MALVKNTWWGACFGLATTESIMKALPLFPLQTTKQLIFPSCLKEGIAVCLLLQQGMCFEVTNCMLAKQSQSR